MFRPMEVTELDEQIANFKGSVRTLITTGPCARNVSVPDVGLVIFYDVPVLINSSRLKIGDAENYLRRIGRAGLFGAEAIAITLLDTSEDKGYFDEIMNHNGMKHKLIRCKNAEGFMDMYMYKVDQAVLNGNEKLDWQSVASRFN